MKKTVPGIIRVRNLLMQALGLALGILLSALILLEVVQVLMRYFFATGVIWGRDVSTLMLFSIAWLGAPLVWLKSTHITVDLFPNLVTGRELMRLVINLVMIIFAIVLCIFTLDAIEAFSLLDMPSLGASAAIKFYPVIVGMGLLICAATINIFIDFSTEFSTGETSGD